MMLAVAEVFIVGDCKKVSWISGWMMLHLQPLRRSGSYTVTDRRMTDKLLERQATIIGTIFVDAGPRAG